MKVISLLQPWASLIILGYKKIETRSWNTKFRGQILIHASKSNKCAKSLCYSLPFEQYVPNPATLPYGMILGSINIIDTVTTDSINNAKRFSNGIIVNETKSNSWDLTDEELAFGDYGPGRYAYLMDGVQKLSEPIPSPGKLSLWDLPKDLEHLIQCTLLSTT